MPFSNDPSKLGTKLGPKLAHLVSQAVISTKRQLLHTEHQARVLSMQEIIDRAGREIADLYGPIWKKDFNADDLPDHVREHVDKIMSGRHQWQAIAGIAFGSSGVSSAFSQVLSNYLADSVRAIISKDPLLAPPPETLAALGAKGFMDLQTVFALGEGQGYSRVIMAQLIAAAKSYPDVTTMLELLRRNLIATEDAQLFLQHAGIPVELHPQFLDLQTVPLSPADLADMVVRGIKEQGQAATIAAQSGVDATDFDALVRDTGEPLALMQLLEAYRRKFIDQARLVHGIKQSRIRDEWVDVAERLRFVPMSVADAVNAVVQNHMPQATGNDIAEQNGLEPGAFDILYETAGEPLSRTEMEELYNRGLVTEEEVKQALRESRLKNKYVDAAFALHRRIIPVRSLHEALRLGSITHDDAVRIAMEDGYTQHDAEILVATGSGSKIETFKGRIVSAIESMYEDNAIPEAEALDMIKGLGYDDTEAKFILQAATFRRSARFVTQATTAIRTRYVARKIDRTQASNDLDGFGVPARQRDQLLGLWDFEREANVKSLTEAQIIHLMKKQAITPEDALTRLEALGYSQDDATLLIEAG